MLFQAIKTSTIRLVKKFRNKAFTVFTLMIRGEKYRPNGKLMTALETEGSWKKERRLPENVALNAEFNDCNCIFW